MNVQTATDAHSRQSFTLDTGCNRLRSSKNLEILKTDVLSDRDNGFIIPICILVQVYDICITEYQSDLSLLQRVGCKDGEDGL